MTTVHEGVGRALGIDYRLAFGAAAEFTLSASARE
jgi:hypothetical protein